MAIFQKITGMGDNDVIWISAPTIENAAFVVAALGIDEKEEHHEIHKIFNSNESNEYMDGVDYITDGDLENNYVCPDCKISWSDIWECACNDRCPQCNKEIEPTESKVYFYKNADGEPDYKKITDQGTVLKVHSKEGRIELKDIEKNLFENLNSYRFYLYPGTPTDLKSLGYHIVCREGRRYGSESRESIIEKLEE